MRSSWIKTISAAAALFCLGSAQAVTLNFNATNYDPLNHRTVYEEQGVKMTGLIYLGEEYDPELDEIARDYGAGIFINGQDSGSCGTVAVCPSGNPTPYYAGINDGYLGLAMADGSSFRVNGFDAAFLGASDTSIPAIAGTLFVQAYHAAGDYINVAFTLNGLSNGKLSFQSLVASGGQLMLGSGSLANDEFTSMFIFSTACDATGRCDAFSTNRGQFGIDNISLTAVAAVPEPSQWLLMGLGLAAVGAVARRRKPAAA